MSIECFDGSLKVLPEESFSVIHLWGCSKIPFENFQAVIHRSPNLQRLELHGCTQVNDRWIEEVVAHCRKISILALADCRSVTKAAVCAIRYLPELRELSLENIDIQGPLTLPETLQRLYLFSIASLTNEDLEGIANTLARIEKLSIQRCGLVTFQGFRPFISHHSVREIYLPIQISQQQCREWIKAQTKPAFLEEKEHRMWVHLPQRENSPLLIFHPTHLP